MPETAEAPGTEKLYFGVDGCPGGWIVARADAALRDVDFVLCRDFREVLGLAGSGTHLSVDIPIGLADNDARPCDRAARDFLPTGRKSSIFPAPCRATLAGKSYPEECALNRGACGKAISKQLHYILPKIRQVDGVITPELQERVHESHPEVVFAVLAGNTHPLSSKKTPEGYAERLDLLARYLGPLDPAWLDRERRRFTRPGEGAPVALDDVVDALACLVAAWRIFRGEACRFPSGREEYDSHGLRMEIVG